MKRPLPKDAIEYAARDTSALLELLDLLGGDDLIADQRPLNA
jgi:ribonuclease D